MRDVGTANRDFDGDVVTARFEPSERMRAYESMSHTSEQAHQWQETLKLHILKLGRIRREAVAKTRFSDMVHKKVLSELKVNSKRSCNKRTGRG